MGNSGLIGKGGHAYVYEAHDPFLSLDVAIKIIPSSRDTGRDLVARARSEARILVRIGHPNVVKIMDAGATDDGLVYLVMEKLDGRDLRKVLRQYTRLAPVEALRIAAQTAEAVAAAHAAGAIHRDLKPENVFICQDHLVKVLDFGIAKVMGYGAPTTQKDLLHGTVLYMPPEQLKGFGVTERSDVFSLGTLLYETLHQHPALLGKEVPTVQELGWIQIERMPPLLSKVDPGIPAHVARFVQRAIMKSPDQRYSSMAEMAEAARTALNRLVGEIRSRGAAVVERDLSVAPSPEAQTATLSGAADEQVSDLQPMVPSTRNTELLSGSSTPPPPPAPDSRRGITESQQLTPPPTISQVAPRPATMARRLSGELPWRKLAIAGSAVGIGLGVVYAMSDMGPKRATRAAPVQASGGAVVQVAARPEASAATPEPTVPAATANPTPATLEAPLPHATNAPSAPSTVTSSPKPGAQGGVKPAASVKSSRSAMDERLDWLEKDLGGKPQAAKPQKRARPEFPSIGVGSEP